MLLWDGMQLQYGQVVVEQEREEGQLYCELGLH